jgi:hypothetical protein
MFESSGNPVVLEFPNYSKHWHMKPGGENGTAQSAQSGLFFLPGAGALFCE